MPTQLANRPIEIIIPNLNKRFSGITSTISAVVPHQAKDFKIITTGTPFSDQLPHLTTIQLIRELRLQRDQKVIFHARRNNEMLFGLILKKLFAPNLHLVFTSTAQRKHSRWTRFLYQRMDTLLSTSPRAASFLIRKPDAIISHGVDTETYLPSQNRDAEWLETKLPGKYGIGIFGRVRPQKGLQEFVESLCQILPKHPEFTAVIIGETTPKFEPFVKNLQAIIAHHNLTERFIWLGKQPFSQIPIWFRRMSLVACVSRNEGFGLTCLEAMASGAAVVGTQTGAFDWVIRDSIDGKVVPCNDTQALANALDQLLQNPEKLTQMGQNARNRILSSFKIQSEAQALNQVYQNILSSICTKS